MKHVLPKLSMFISVLYLTSSFVAGQTVTQGPKYCLNNFGQKEWTLLTKDLSAENKRKLVEDPDFKKQQVEKLRHLLALACQSEKEGLAAEAVNAQELKSIRTSVIAFEYDKATTKGQAGPPFFRITDAQIADFYKIPGNTAAFERFLRSKVEILNRESSTNTISGLTEDEKAQAREFFAKERISEIEYGKNAVRMGEPFRSTVEMKVRMQQAQFLAREYSNNVLSEKTHVGDREVANYVARHAEFKVSEKKELASKLLARAKAGEDFAALADQYTDDPGNKGADGKKHGGLYTAVPRGTMVRSFEDAALSLQPGQLSPDLVETDFGFHIIKLDKTSGTGADLKYDVRHILVSTMQKDPDDPNGRDVPLKEFVRNRLESEKEDVIMTKVIADNPIAISDYTPPVTAPAKPGVKRPVVKKPAARKTRK